MKIRQLLTVFITVLLFSCSSGNQEQKYQRTVRTVNPIPEGGSINRRFSGTVNESNEISLGFKTAGQINGIYVKEGDFVKKGTLLASLESSDYEIGAEGLRAQAEQLKSEYERACKLYEEKSIALNDLEKIKAGYIQINSQLKSVENKLAYTRLYAPVSGHIQSVNFSKSEMVDAGTPVFNILDDSSMVISVDIPVALYGNIGNISRIYARPDIESQAIPLQILSVVPKADSNQLFRMKLAFPGTYDNYLSAGMNIDIEFIMNNGVAAAGSKSLIPAHSVLHRNDSTFVWVVNEDSLIIKRPVSIENLNPDGMVMVRDGLSEKDNVVTTGINMLQEGERVRILTKPAKTNVGGLL